MDIQEEWSGKYEGERTKRKGGKEGTCERGKGLGETR